jgi:hypothetical protein
MTGRGQGGDRGEVMQMDAGMGVTGAIMDFLIHVRRGVHYLMQGIPTKWRDVSFENIRTEGAFLISATRSNGQVRSVDVLATIANPFKIANPWPTGAKATGGNLTSAPNADILEIKLAANQKVRLEPATIVK